MKRLTNSALALATLTAFATSCGKNCQTVKNSATKEIQTGISNQDKNILKGYNYAQKRISQFFSREKNKRVELLKMVRNDLSESGYHFDDNLGVLKNGKRPKEMALIDPLAEVTNPVDSIAHLKHSFLTNFKALSAVAPEKCFKYTVAGSEKNDFGLSIQTAMNPLVKKASVNGTLGGMKIDAEGWKNILGMSEGKIDLGNAVKEKPFTQEQLNKIIKKILTTNESYNPEEFPIPAKAYAPWKPEQTYEVIKKDGDQDIASNTVYEILLDVTAQKKLDDEYYLAYKQLGATQKPMELLKAHGYYK